MPLDTTYVYLQDGTGTTVHVVPGGADTTIYVQSSAPQSFTDSFVENTNAETHRLLTQPLPKYDDHGYTPGPVFLIIFLSIFLFILWNVKREIKNGAYDESASFEDDSVDYASLLPKKNKPRSLTYYGDELDFSTDQYDTILTKHLPYYNNLNEIDKAKFIDRVNSFITAKTFKIHADSGFKEMPVLISAAAIQLTFGLKKYLLPNFEFIHIFPQEFLRVEPVLCFLEGNVSGHCINISWKHFLDGFSDTADGKNVGLHEMSHALYYQNFVADDDIDDCFKDNFSRFNTTGAEIFEQQKNSSAGIYSSYAFTNFQEFWAESVEVFFERSAAFNTTFPELYKTMATILNQSPDDALN